jgi:cytochrome c oxidase cbb3-type subunit 2
MKWVALRAALVTAAIYGYFLIFAQFAFVEIIRSDFAKRAVTGGNAEKIVLGCMAIAGIIAGFWVAWKSASPTKIRVALLLSAFSSAASVWAGGMIFSISIAILTGAAIGISTVSLATLIRSWCGLIWVGVGTGIGYACCNLPFVFSQTPAHQAWIASAFAIIGAACVPARAEGIVADPRRVFPFPAVLVLFTALVWLDSAAFFIIQHSLDLRSGTWGDGLLWRNAAIHLLAAIAAGFWLKHGAAKSLPALAWILLAAAAIAVNNDASRMMAGWLYPAAVSLYSAALVSWPGWFSGVSSERAIGWRAAWIYAVAGWFGSANGIGMAQSLDRVPQEFIVISGICVIGVMWISDLKSWRIVLAVSAVFAAAFWPREKVEPPAGSSFERGKQVYLSEGCIHCHSQYVRPGTRDDEFWGPIHDGNVQSRPVLIGNRRQGPDLTNVGARRSPTWLKLHFIDPQAFSPGSTMPSYARLFEDGRGEDLVSYLRQSGENEVSAIISKAAVWEPSRIEASSGGRALFESHCVVCHGSEGTGDGLMAGLLGKAPANLVDGPFIWSPSSPDRDLKISRIIKFGIPGTDMPGHETLTDPQILSLQKYITSLRSR